MKTLRTLPEASAEITDGVIFTNRIIFLDDVYGANHASELDAFVEARDLALDLLDQTPEAFLASGHEWEVEPTSWADVIAEMFADDERVAYVDIALRELLYT
jgi:hypothetical protein